MSKRFISLLLFILLVIPFAGCEREEYVEKTIFAMDTIISIRIESRSDSKELFTNCEELIKDVEGKLSKHIEGSEVSLFNDSDSGFTLSKETAELISLSLDVSRNSDGAFDITCEPLTELWDITGDDPVIPDNQDVEYELTNVGYDKLTLSGYELKKEPMVKIDLGGVGKGYALSLVVNYLEGEGVKYGTVSFGGNIGIIGGKPDDKPWKIGIKDPRSTDDIIGTLSLEGGYTAVSGDYERYFISEGIRYHHILDPMTGYPVNNGVQSVAIVCEDGALADALSTACFVMGYEKSLELYNKEVYDFEAVFVTEDGIEYTPGIKDKFTLK